MAESKILHIAQDEKFINAAYCLFEKAFPGANRFVILKPVADPPVRFLGTKVQKEAFFEIRSANTVDKLVRMSRNHHVTVFHGLNGIKGAIFLKSPHKDRFMTIVYGAEVYNKEIAGKEFIGEKTRKLYDSTQKKTLFDLTKDIYRSVKYRNLEDFDHVNTAEVLSKMQVFGSLPSFSYEKFIEKGLYNPMVRKVPFSYYPLEFILKDPTIRANGPDILLGNSASATNNHVEALDLLSNFDLNGKKIFTPLSYGREKYAKGVISYAKEIFSDDFEPLTEFLPLEEYNKVLSRCGVVIMNHYRPQAMGNIIASLYMGAKVFLNDTDAYRYFKKLGCHVYLVEEELTPKKDPFALLSDEEIAHNRKVLHDELSTSKLVDKMRTAFREIFDFNQSGSKFERADNLNANF